jgi:transcriptional regulator with XRE-family HTH domain
MNIAARLRQLREAKKLSQGDIERRSGLLRSYISRVENGHSVPTIETLEKISQALGVPLYGWFYEGQKLPEAPIFSEKSKPDWASHGKGQRFFTKLRRAVSHATESDRRLLLYLAAKLAAAKRKT